MHQLQSVIRLTSLILLLKLNTESTRGMKSFHTATPPTEGGIIICTGPTYVRIREFTIYSVVNKETGCKKRNRDKTPPTQGIRRPWLPAFIGPEHKSISTVLYCFTAETVRTKKKKPLQSLDNSKSFSPRSSTKKRLSYSSTTDTPDQGG